MAFLYIDPRVIIAILWPYLIALDYSLEMVIYA